MTEDDHIVTVDYEEDRRPRPDDRRKGHPGDRAIYAVKDDGQLLWYFHSGWPDGAPTWDGPKVVGDSWQFRHVFAGPDGVLYGVRANGDLVWYRHDGQADGSSTWQGPKVVGTSWDFEHVFGGWGGGIYAVRADGTLLWYRHDGQADGTVAWLGPKTVGEGWQFEHVFSSGETDDDGGVIYAVASNGDLNWYLHEGRVDGTFAWQGPNVIAQGWNYRHVFGAGHGVIYGVTPRVLGGDRIEAVRTEPGGGGLKLGGDLMWHLHDGRTMGTDEMRGPTKVGSSWVFAHVLAG